MIFKRKSTKKLKPTMSVASYRQAINEALVMALQYESLSLRYYAMLPDRTGDVELAKVAIQEMIARLAGEVEACLDGMILWSVQLDQCSPPDDRLATFHEAAVVFVGTSAFHNKHMGLSFENSIVFSYPERAIELSELASKSEKRLENAKRDMIGEIQKLAQNGSDSLIDIGVFLSILAHLYLDDLADEVEKRLNPT